MATFLPLRGGTHLTVIRVIFQNQATAQAQAPFTSP